MGKMKASSAIAIGLLGAASAMAADVRPSALNAPTASAIVSNIAVGHTGRVGFKRSRKGSDIAPAVLPILLIAGAAAAGGAVAATSGNGGHSDNNPTVSPS